VKPKAEGGPEGFPHKRDAFGRGKIRDKRELFDRKMEDPPSPSVAKARHAEK
jgi:hypothetical protein